MRRTDIQQGAVTVGKMIRQSGLIMLLSSASLFAAPADESSAVSGSSAQSQPSQSAADRDALGDRDTAEPSNMNRESTSSERDNSAAAQSDTSRRHLSDRDRDASDRDRSDMDRSSARRNRYSSDDARYERDGARQNDRERGEWRDREDRFETSRGDWDRDEYQSHDDRARSARHPGYTPMARESRRLSMRDDNYGDRDDSYHYRQVAGTFRLEGTIESIRNLDADRDSGHADLLVTVNDPRFGDYTVNLGPRAEITDLNLNRSDRITVRGRCSHTDADGHLIASTLEFRGERIALSGGEGERLAFGQGREFQGEILSTRGEHIRGEDHLLARTRLDTGIIEVIDLGPRRNLREVDLREGDRIRFRGERSEFDGRNRLVAIQIDVGGRMMDIDQGRQMRLQGQPVSPRGRNLDRNREGSMDRKRSDMNRDRSDMNQNRSDTDRDRSDRDPNRSKVDRDRSTGDQNRSDMDQDRSDRDRSQRPDRDRIDRQKDENSPNPAGQELNENRSPNEETGRDNSSAGESNDTGTPQTK